MFFSIILFIDLVICNLYFNYIEDHNIIIHIEAFIPHDEIVYIYKFVYRFLIPNITYQIWNIGGMLLFSVGWPKFFY